MFLNILITIGILALCFKLTGFIFKLAGKLLGLAFSIIGYVLLACLAVPFIGMALIAIPLVVIGGIIAIVSALVRL
ncbi:MAG: hypothetical protein Q4B67_05820 [Eubacteriales bacterium]|nr:hypothetical protein [Eubacteriales bacterium]